MAHLKLNDGTEISINSCSKLSYPSQFSGKERKVYLSGEAYFEVKHNENVPFVVVCDHQSIKVLGTKFNVMTYPNDKYSETTLIQGKVEILDTLGHLVTDLNPGQLYNQDNDNNNFTVSNVNTILYTSWKDGYYIFNHESLKNIAERLERIFDVNITFRDQTVLNYKFSGKILKNYPIEQVLQILKLTSPVNYNIKENKDGRKNITIFSNKRAS
jgi:ferric-dicitrate binding protein FerR (iron transport regulator)